MASQRFVYSRLLQCHNCLVEERKKPGSMLHGAFWRKVGSWPLTSELQSRSLWARPCDSSLLRSKEREPSPFLPSSAPIDTAGYTSAAHGPLREVFPHLQPKVSSSGINMNLTSHLHHSLKGERSHFTGTGVATSSPPRAA